MHEAGDALQGDQALPLVVELVRDRRGRVARELGRHAGRRDEDVGAGDDHPEQGALAVVVERGVGLGQVGDAGRAVDEGLDEAELDEHGERGRVR